MIIDQDQENTMKLLNETREDLARAGRVTSQDVYEAWLDDIEPELRQDLEDMGILVEYWLESLVCLGEDLHYALTGSYPMGRPYDLQEAIAALGVTPLGEEADWALWEDMVRCGYLDVYPVEGAVVAYYRHPMLDPGVPFQIAAFHAHV